MLSMFWPYSYNLERVMEYTNVTFDTHITNPISSLSYQVNLGPQCGYSNINVILIYSVKCRQLGYDINSILTSEIISDIRITLNVFASLLFFKSWLRPVENLDEDICDAILANFTLQNIKKCLIDKSWYDLDLYEIYKKSNTNVGNEVIDILNHMFTLPKKSIIKSGLVKIKR